MEDNSGCFSATSLSPCIHTNDIYCVKGILRFKNEPFEFILQVLGGSFEITEGENLVSYTKSEMVLIGKLAGINLRFQIN